MIIDDNKESLDKYVEGLLKFTNYAYGYYMCNDIDTARQCLTMADKYYNKLYSIDPDYTKHFSETYLRLRKELTIKGV